MKVIIAGSRTIHYSSKRINKIVLKAEEIFEKEISELVCGMCPDGIDTCALDWKDLYRPHLKLQPFPADWDGAKVKFGSHKPAGNIRNGHMADYADALILIWDGVSSGSASMLQEALDRGLKIFEVIVKKKS